MHTVHIVCGSPGCGKSTYGSNLAREIGAVLLDIDTCTEKLVIAALSSNGQDSTDRDSPFFKTTFREPIYDTLFSIGRDNVMNIDVVIVGPFTKEIRNVNWPSALQDKLSSSVKIHYVYCHPDVRRQRLIDRGNPRDASKLENWNAHSHYYGGEERPGFDHLYIDTS